MQRSVTGRTGTRTAGMTLLELVIAIFILAIASMATLRASEQSRRGIGEEMARLLAQEVALNRAEELKLFGVARGQNLPEEVAMGGQVFSVNQSKNLTAVGVVEVTISVRSRQGPGVRVVTYLPVEAKP